LNKKELTGFKDINQGPFKSPGKWNISSVSNETKDTVKLANVTRTLVLEENSQTVNNGVYLYMYNLIIILKRQ